MRLVSVNEAAYMMGVTPVTIWNYIKQGRLPAVKFDNSRVFRIDIGPTLKAKGVDVEALFAAIDKRYDKRTLKNQHLKVPEHQKVDKPRPCKLKTRKQRAME